MSVICPWHRSSFGWFRFRMCFLIAMMRCSETLILACGFRKDPIGRSRQHWSTRCLGIYPSISSCWRRKSGSGEDTLSKTRQCVTWLATRSRFSNLFFVGQKSHWIHQFWWLRGLRLNGWCLRVETAPGIRPINRAWAPYNLQRCMLTKKPWRSHLIWKWVGWKLP